MTVELVRVGDVLHLERRAVEIRPEVQYRLIGVYSFGKGIFHRDPKSGAELGNYRFYEVHPGDLVLSNIQAWEGAIAHATSADSGSVATNRFLTYVPVDNRIDTNWARYFFLSEVGFPLIQKAAPGSVTRNRTLAIDRFENLMIPLPAKVQQERMVAQLEARLDAAWSMAERLKRATHLEQFLVDSIVDAIVGQSSVAGWPELPLSDVATVNPTPAKVEGMVAFVPMSAVNDKLGRIERPQIHPISELKSGYKQFRRGDVIFARITPCMQNGKSAVMEVEEVEFGLGSTEFHVLRPAGEVLPEWLHRVVRSRSFRERAMNAFTGTAGQQRVPTAFLRSAQIPVPPLDVQRVLVRDVDRVAGLGEQLGSLRKTQLERASALSRSILNHAFVAVS